MSVREFLSASGDSISLSIGNCALGYGTLAILCKFDAAGIGVFRSLVDFKASGVNVWGLVKPANDRLRWRNDSGTNVTTSTMGVTSGRWYLLGMGKASGSQQPRFHLYDFSSPGWSHETPGTSSANAATPDEIVISGADIRIAAMGFWGSSLSDGNVEALLGGFTVWLTNVAPLGAWLFTQSETAQAVADLAGGGANQSAITGTTVAADNSPLPLLIPRIQHHRRLMGVA